MDFKIRPVRIRDPLAEEPKRKPVGKKKKKSILERQNGKCWRCHKKKRVRLMLHHKDMNTRNNHPKNLAYVCPDCHAIIHQKHKKVPRLRSDRFGLPKTKYVKVRVVKKHKGKKPKRRRRRKSWSW